ncbi:serine hydrolase [Vibrio alginolyticus]|uniref:serine hydrolase n=1 Tax=Vibrio alginolyticus TaxID=663 RepID=UPI0035BFA460
MYLSVNCSGENYINRLHRNFPSLPYTRNQHSSNTTGDNRIRAAADKSWVVGDKTGTCGAYGAASDVAVIWREKSSPLVMAIYTHKTDPTAKHSDKVIAEVADKTFQYIASQ